MIIRRIPCLSRFFAGWQLKNNKYKHMKKYMILLATLALFSCKKQDKWLDVKSNKADIVPVTLDDFQALMDNDAVMNANYPGLGLLASDNYFLTYAFWQSLQPRERNAFLWKPDIYEGDRCPDWEYEYKRIEYANIALEGINNVKVDGADKPIFDQIKGSALFYRAYSFYNLLQLFSVPYDPSTASTALGIPLRLNADVNDKSTRASVAQCYDRVIQDLLAAKDLLPSSSATMLRPSKTATLALLARVSLTMKTYDKSAGYASDALNQQNGLIDFNTLNLNASVMLPPFIPGNPEVIFYATSISYYTLSRLNMKIDTLLYRSYDKDDLRRIVFYKDNGSNGISFRGDYTGKTLPSKFAGIATNELYLIRAESYARLNKPAEALAGLNHLLQSRWKTGTYVPKSGTDANEILANIIQERRKELPFSGNLPWEDLRRLNQEPNFAKTLTRMLNGETFSLPPGDNRYVYPIPENEISLSGIQQNPR